MSTENRFGAAAGLSLVTGEGKTPIKVPQYEGWIIQLVNGEIILATDVSRELESSALRLSKPRRLVPHSDREGKTLLAFAPMIAFLPAESQDFQTLDINITQVLYYTQMSTVMTDGGRLAKAYRSAVSGLIL